LRTLRITGIIIVATTTTLIIRITRKSAGRGTAGGECRQACTPDVLPNWLIQLDNSDRLSVDAKPCSPARVSKGRQRGEQFADKHSPSVCAHWGRCIES